MISLSHLPVITILKIISLDGKILISVLLGMLITRLSMKIESGLITVFPVIFPLNVSFLMFFKTIMIIYPIISISWILKIISLIV